MQTHWTEFMEHCTGEDRLLSWKAVREDTGLSRTTAWRLQKDGQFPRSVMLSPGRVGYRQREIEAWKRSRVPRSDSEPPRRERPQAPRKKTEPARVATSRRDDPVPEPTPPKVASQQPEPRTPPSLRARSRKADAHQLALDF